MENNPTAPAPAPEAGESVAPNTNTNGGQSGEAAPAITPQVSKKAEIPADQVEAWNRFMENNGGFANAFQKIKDTIANPPAQDEGKPAQPTTNAQVQAQAQAQAPVAPTAPEKPAEGFISPTEIAALQYNRMLSEQYPDLAEYTSKGEYLKEMAQFGMVAVDQNGNLNDKVIRQFLDLKQKTIPPKPTEAPITSTPTAQYTQTEGEISSQEQAREIIGQGNGHPKFAEAQDYLLKQLYPSQNKPTQK